MKKKIYNIEMETNSIELWMKMERFKYIERNYSSTELNHLQPTLGDIILPSHLLSKKLYQHLQRNKEEKKTSKGQCMQIRSTHC